MENLDPSQSVVQAARVMVVGDAMLDRYWFGAVDRISPEAPVPVVRITRDEERLGGAANAALNVVTLGAQATLLTVLGSDEPGQHLRELLAKAGIQAELELDPLLHSTVKLRIIGRAQQLIRLDFENQPPGELLLRLLDRYTQALAEHDAVLCSDYGKGGLTHLPRMIELARAAGKAVLVDPKGSDYTPYAGASVLTPNKAELAQVVGAWKDEAALAERAQALRERLGLEALVMTRAEEGMSLFDAEGRLDVPAVAREVYDVTGAGDTVIAVLACMLAAGLSLRQALPIANRAGGLVVGKFGTAGVSYAELFG
ncbi:D-glycero-beta-D-manno-heptose-7-phosphate kinase [Paucibacter soli]|uniref:D-glycero-beta-D-manno-heptose-7-phosphate kinase n=1 Tax=Paucibacter soli TaxID=3133433 RepID=UPI0030A70663